MAHWDPSDPSSDPLSTRLKSTRVPVHQTEYEIDKQLVISNERKVMDPHLSSQNLGRVTDATDHTKTARICDCRSQLRACRHIHP